MRCAITRDRMSVGPPAGNGTMMRTVRSGNVFASGLCANALPARASMSSHSATSRCKIVMQAPRTNDPTKHRRARAREPQPQLALIDLDIGVADDHRQPLGLLLQ